MDIKIADGIQYSPPLTYDDAELKLKCSRTSLYRMIDAGTVIRQYMGGGKRMPRVFIPVNLSYTPNRTASGEEQKEAQWPKSTPAKAPRIGGRATRTPVAAKRLENLLASPPKRA